MRLIVWAVVVPLAVYAALTVYRLLPTPPPVRPGQGNVLIVAAGTGLGLESVRWLTKRGYTVYGTYRSDAADLAKELPADRVIRMDVLNATSVKSALARFRDSLSLRAIVLSAGSFVGTPIEHSTDEEVESVVLTSVMGFYRVVRETLPALRRGAAQFSRSTVIDISSPSAYVAFPFWGAYNAAKAANSQLANVLRYELRGQNIDVVSMLPAMLKTRMVDGAIEETRAIDKKWENTHYAGVASFFKKAFLSMHGPHSLRSPELMGPVISEVIESAPTPSYRYKVGNAPPLLMELIPQHVVEWMLANA